MTKDQFIAHESHVWGSDYVFDLLDRGYVVVMTSEGKWGWQMPAYNHNSYAKNGR